MSDDSMLGGGVLHQKIRIRWTAEVARSAGSPPTPDVRAQPGTPRNRRRHEPSSGLRGLHPRHGNQRSAY